MPGEGCKRRAAPTALLFQERLRHGLLREPLRRLTQHTTASLIDVEHSLTLHRHVPQSMPLGGELGDVTNKLSALNVVDGADASKLQACAPRWRLRA